MHYFNPMLRRASKYSKRISCRRYWPLAISESAVLKHSSCAALSARSQHFQSISCSTTAFCYCSTAVRMQRALRPRRAAPFICISQRHGARCLPHAQYARFARYMRHWTSPLSDDRHGGLQSRSAAFLYQCAIRHCSGAQWQSDEFGKVKGALFRIDRRRLNTQSDSEVLLNVLAHELQQSSAGYALEPDALFAAVSGLHARVRGSYAMVALISGHGLLCVRDPYGIRPLCMGLLETPQGTAWMAASESVALESAGFKFMRDVAPGEAVFIDVDGHMQRRQCAAAPALNPCLFEYVYLARPDSCLDGVPVYEARLRMGDYLAQKISRVLSSGEIDAVMPIPESSRPAAMQVANRLGLAYREGFIKNRYVGRTFIMPGQAIRTKSVRQKLNAMRVEFKGRNVLIVDDSIVRGTTSQQIVQMARDAGANKVFFASAAPPVQFPNVYGIDMPTRNELVAYGRSAEEVARFIGADRLVYQDLDAMQQAVRDLNPLLARFEASCFDGQYVTGDITNEYLESLERMRSSPPDALQDWGL